MIEADCRVDAKQVPELGVGFQELKNNGLSRSLQMDESAVIAKHLEPSGGEGADLVFAGLGTEFHHLAICMGVQCLGHQMPGGVAGDPMGGSLREVENEELAAIAESLIEGQIETGIQQGIGDRSGDH